MAKEWILNSALNRWQFNYKRNVGATSATIRECSPKSVEEWREYYYHNVKSEEHIEELGKRLYIKITEVLPAEIESITEEDCIEYIKNLVINRTFDGYWTEITTIYGQLEQILDVKIEPAPDEWDRLFNVDFYIQIGLKYIGLQIKPVNNVAHIPQIYKEHQLQLQTHQKFTEEYGGKVFFVFSLKQGNKKVIANEEVIQDIKNEIKKITL